MKNSNTGLYILAVLIVLVSARFAQVQIQNHTPKSEKIESIYSLHMVANDIYYSDTDFIAEVQVTDRTGQRVETEISVSLENTNAEIPMLFNTDDTGKAQIKFPLENLETGRYNLLINISSELGKEKFEREIFVSTEENSNFIINFDKGLYNPGDTVLFRILALANAFPIAGREFSLSIFDGNNNRVFSENVSASDFGIISGRFVLGDEVNSGMYRLVVEHDGDFQAQTTFEVSPFVLPRFEISLQTDKTEYSTGETIQFSGNAMYFFGEPVNQGTVNVYVNNIAVLSGHSLDENGNFELTHEAKTAGLYDFQVEVTDNSNFRIENSLSVRATDGAFEIEIIPEHGDIIFGVPNTLYIFTHTPNGEPVRTYIQIAGNGFSRQVATDENGMGMFILDDPISSNHITITATDMDGNMVLKEFWFQGRARNATLATDKPRYAIGEPITLNLSRRVRNEHEGNFIIHVYKNDRLLKVIETEHDKVELNLGDTFGLIDIYAVHIPPWENRPTEHLSHARRTIFIDPGNYMQLTVQSESQEYMPGQFVSLDIGVTDKSGIPLEAALLVSIVDEAMLSLAANDLSIDNIRLALKDIRFGDDLDAAELYASLIANASEQAITRLLLRQGEAAPPIRTIDMTNYPPMRHESHAERNERAFQSFLRVLRIIVILQLSIAFFILLYTKRNEKSYENPYLPDATADENHISAKHGTAWLVAVTLAIVFFLLFFLSGCGSGSRFENDAMMTPHIQNAGEDVGWNSVGSNAFEPGLSDNASAPQRPFERAPMPESDESPSGDDSFSAPAAPREIETQTARVRRLFLETMLFVPELIAHNGNANLQFLLADNITTWNIQVVGNTKDGIIGHTQSNLRAFQPFFTDFELPRNSIRYDEVSIPVTVFNYTEDEQEVILTVAELDWFELHGDAVQTLVIPSGRSQMVYVPITITSFGDFVFRVYADTLDFSDAAERPIRVNPEGFQVRRVVSSGSIENDTQLHLLFMNEYVSGTPSATVTFYPSVMSQVVEGMENIFRMPYGCFEQTSSILYPNILALRYMRQNNTDNPALSETALKYISAGYHRILTFETRERGGFSLYGHSPAEPLLTAYGLMQLKDLTSVYSIDEAVIERMSTFLFSKQNRDGTFELTPRNRLDDTQRLAFNAYIIWALSETFPNDSRLAVSVEYLISRLQVANDNYTRALIANVLVNTKNPRASEVIDRLISDIQRTDDGAYITSSTRDYFGAFGKIQYLQTTALTSYVLSKSNSHPEINELLINYIISQRDTWGTWHSTQATILSLKALTTYTAPSPLQDGKITATIGSQQHIIDVITENSLDFYQVRFSDLQRENIINIQFPDLGKMTYSVVQEYYAPYDSVPLDRGFKIQSQMNTSLSVHELTHQEIIIVNTSGAVVNNGLVAVTIPQGFRPERSSLELLIHEGIIERYEFSFDNINMYLRDTFPSEIIPLTISYRPTFPLAVTGGHVRVFDYYNPTVEGFLMPVEITVQ